MQNTDLSIGGQAVIEGVLMRNKDNIAIAVRTEKGKIILKKEKIDGISKKYPFLAWPFFRGIVGFFQMLVIGMKALTYSTNVALGEEEEVLNAWEIVGLIGFSMLFAIGLFVLVPYVITHVIGFDERSSPILFNLVDGLIKLIIFISYVAVIGYMEDIKRVFQYHGAEHKAVNCFESGKKLTVANVKKFSTIHPRCGTSFIAIVLLVGIFILSVISPITNLLIPSFSELSFILQKVILFLLRILFLFPIAAVSYEILKLAGKYKDNKILQLVNAPGLLIQKITTREPDNKMIEVAIKSLKAVL
ncbi:hypothetical protein COV16_05930 [Candidatus Woesearchaeota archaeon CG10_big_fil_rev_8_21_14_0_10_34_8]|nr:MAG: hypothetical protein COV16_05930 [Candidatus Woesearchaeota archaeon CG10_big_fil_rev_8_21_14_0_10_34_8]